MAQEGSCWARGGRRDVVNSAVAGGCAGGWWAGVHSAGSPRKMVLGGVMYAALGGVGYFAADALGLSILRLRRMQAGGEEAKQAAAEGPSLSSVLEALPPWFPIRKIGAEELAQKQREMEERAEAEAAEARQRWAKDIPELRPDR